MEVQVDRDLFEGLVNQDAKGKAIPGVALSWQTSDNQNFVFHLRRDARWSNGQTVTAHDFVYSWRRLVDPANHSTFSWFAELAGLKNAGDVIAGKLPAEQLGVIAPDEYTLKVALDKPVPVFRQPDRQFQPVPGESRHG